MITNIEIELNILEICISTICFFWGGTFNSRNSLSSGRYDIKHLCVCVRARVIPVVDGRDNDKRQREIYRVELKPKA